MKTRGLAVVFISFIMLAFSSVSGARTLHLVAVSDSADENIGTDVAVDTVNVFHLLKGVSEKAGLNFNPVVIASGALPAEAYRAGGPRNPNLKGLVENSDISPTISFTKAAIRKTLNDLKVGRDDVIFFHYAGHGFRWTDQQATWPALDLGGWASSEATSEAELRKAAEKSIQMSEIMATLEKKGARLTITISDSCNEDAELKMPKGTAAKRGKDKLAEAFAKLFVLARGYIRISSTKPGELAWGDSDVGGVFSYLLITGIMAEARNKGASAEWKSILKPMKSAINMVLDSGERTDDQHPRVDFSITYESGSQTTTIDNNAVPAPQGNLAAISKPAKCPKGSVQRTIGVSKFCVHAPSKSGKCRKGFRRRTVKSKKGKRRLCVSILKDLKAPVAQLSTGSKKSLYTKGKCPKGYKAIGKKGALNRCAPAGSASGASTKPCAEGRLVGKGPRAVCLVTTLRLKAPCTPGRCSYIVNTNDGVVLAPAKRKGKRSSCAEGKYSPRHRMCVVAKINTQIKKQPKICSTMSLAGKKGAKLLRRGKCKYWVENNKARRPGLYRNPVRVAQRPPVRPKSKLKPKKRVR